MRAAALGSRSSYSSSTSIGSRGYGWRPQEELHHDWTLKGAGPPPLALCSASQPHAGWAWVGGGGCPGSVVPALRPSPQPGGLGRGAKVLTKNLKPQPLPVP